MDDFCRSLKSWRSARRLSQLDLALEANISARHLSFLETGRARPSREMVARIGDALNLPLDARNQLLTHAGFAVRYKGRDWEEPEMAPIRQAVDRTLANHMPFPGIAIDRLWRLRAANPVARDIFGQFGLDTGGSLLELMMSPELSDVVENWDEVAYHVAARLRLESASQGGIPELDAAARYLAGSTIPPVAATGPVVPTILSVNGLRLSMFATVSQFGTPEDLTLDDLKIELYFPMDKPTEEIFGMIAASAGS